MLATVSRRNALSANQMQRQPEKAVLVKKVAAIKAIALLKEHAGRLATGNLPEFFVQIKKRLFISRFFSRPIFNWSASQKILRTNFFINSTRDATID